METVLSFNSFEAISIDSAGFHFSLFLSVLLPMTGMVQLPVLGGWVYNQMTEG